MMFKQVRAIALFAVLASLVGGGSAWATHRFADVPDDHAHVQGINYVAAEGITSGCDRNDFCPDDLLTRAQMATFLHRASGHASGVAPSVNAATVQGLGPEDLKGEKGEKGDPGPQGPAGPSGGGGGTQSAKVTTYIPFHSPGDTTFFVSDEVWRPIGRLQYEENPWAAAVPYDGSGFDASAAVTIRARIDLAAGATACIRLVDLTGGAPVSGSEMCKSNTGAAMTTEEFVTQDLSLAPAMHHYVVEAKASGGPTDESGQERPGYLHSVFMLTRQG